MKTLETVGVIVHGLQKLIKLDYQPISQKAMYDICDLNGRVILSGNIQDEITQINISDLISKQYILLILDGDMAVSRKFVVS
ncbi:MAG: hypothetical protein ACI8XB_000459 [Patiriisocius sp.]|jgi:hypothetical protein